MLQFSSTIVMLSNWLSLRKDGKTSAEALNKKDRLNTLSYNGDITQLTESLSLEPVTTVTVNASKIDIYPKINNKLMDMFTVYYTQAFNILYRVNGLSSRETFNLLSSKRTITVGEVVGSVNHLTENELDFPMDFKQPFVENSNTDKPTEGVIRTIKVTIDNTKGEKINLEVVVTNVIKKTTITEIVSLSNDKIRKGTLAYWYNEWRSGVSLIGIIMGDELIKDYKAKKFSQTNDLSDDIDRRVSIATNQILLDGAVGFSKYYNMLVITADEEAVIEKTLGLKMSKDYGKILDTLKSLSITIIDEDFEIVTTYIRNTKGALIKTFKEIQKEKKMEVADLAKLMSTRTI